MATKTHQYAGLEKSDYQTHGFSELQTENPTYEDVPVDNTILFPLSPESQ